MTAYDWKMVICVLGILVGIGGSGFLVWLFLDFSPLGSKWPARIASGLGILLLSFFIAGAFLERKLEEPCKYWLLSNGTKVCCATVIQCGKGSFRLLNCVGREYECVAAKRVGP